MHLKLFIFLYLLVASVQGRKQEIDPIHEQAVEYVRSLYQEEVQPPLSLEEDGLVMAVSTTRVLPDENSLAFQKKVSAIERYLAKQAALQRLRREEAAAQAAAVQADLKNATTRTSIIAAESEGHIRRRKPGRSLLGTQKLYATSSSSMCSILYNKKIYGGSYIPDATVYSINTTTCCSMCALRKDCYAWYVDSKLGICSLKGKGYSVSTVQGATSGTLNQAYWYTGPPPSPSPQPLEPGFDKYGRVMKLTWQFYQAQKRGKFSAVDSNVPWRSSSHTTDLIPGGWYDAGDYLKLNYPLSTSVTFLTWGLLEFEQGYKALGYLDQAKSELRWVVDYLLACWNPIAKSYIGQIGDPDIDHITWTRPENQQTARPAYIWNNTMNASDLLSSVSAALSSASILYKDSDPVGAAIMLEQAIAMYEQAILRQGKYSDYYKRPVASIYPSTDFLDNLSFAAGWLFKATQNTTYLHQALHWWTRDDAHPDFFICWDSVWLGTAVLMRQISRNGVSVPGIETYNNFYHKFYRDWTEADGGGDVVKTPQGMRYPTWNTWANLQFASSTAMMMVLDAKTLVDTADDDDDMVSKSGELDYAQSQIDYALGSTGISFVVGWGHNPPKFPHHAASSCPDKPAPCSIHYFWSRHPNPQPLYGALIGGPPGRRKHPENPDFYEDSRQSYASNEPSVDYNAAFTTALVGLYQQLSLLTEDTMPQSEQPATSPKSSSGSGNNQGDISLSNLQLVGDCVIKTSSRPHAPYLGALLKQRQRQRQTNKMVIVMSKTKHVWQMYQHLDDSSNNTVYFKSKEYGYWLSSNRNCNRVVSFPTLNGSSRRQFVLLLVDQEHHQEHRDDDGKKRFYIGKQCLLVHGNDMQYLNKFGRLDSSKQSVLKQPFQNKRKNQQSRRQEQRGALWFIEEIDNSSDRN